MDVNWILPYTLGSIVSLFIFYNTVKVFATEQIIGKMLDELIEKGFIKSRVNDDGEVVLMKYNDNEED